MGFVVGWGHRPDNPWDYRRSKFLRHLCYDSKSLVSCRNVDDYLFTWTQSKTVLFLKLVQKAVAMMPASRCHGDRLLHPVAMVTDASIPVSIPGGPAADLQTTRWQK
uniref:Uncharacterized protein n=1 Tax=Branchiostoma floridae TaxID=7739 RepID=C3YFG7_BRAFL|eukprot:XP_002604920.1 hypothetical protein BRAFLDRAFT_77230 [Branchiostoma floridae]